MLSGETYLPNGALQASNPPSQIASEITYRHS